MLWQFIYFVWLLPTIYSGGLPACRFHVSSRFCIKTKVAVIIIHWIQGVYLLTEVEENVAVIDKHSSLGWHSSSSVWECLTAAKPAHYLRNRCSVQNDCFPLFSAVVDVWCEQVCGSQCINSNQWNISDTEGVNCWAVTNGMKMKPHGKNTFGTSKQLHTVVAVLTCLFPFFFTCKPLIQRHDPCHRLHVYELEAVQLKLH